MWEWGEGAWGQKKRTEREREGHCKCFLKTYFKKITTHKTSLDKNHGSLNFICCWTAFYHLRRLKVSHDSIWISQVNFELFFGHSFIITYDYIFRLLQWPLGLGNMETRRKWPPGLVIFLHDCMFEVENFTIWIIYDYYISQFIPFLFHTSDISNTAKYSFYI